MDENYRSDAEHSVLRPAGPHLIERTSDTPAQSRVSSEKTVARSFTVKVTTTTPAIVVRPKPGTTK